VCLTNLVPSTYEPDSIILSRGMHDYRRSFGLDFRFIDYFNTQLVIPLNCSAIVNFYTRAHVKSFPARSAFTSSCLLTASNNGYSSVSRLKSSLNGGSLPTEIFFSKLKSSQSQSHVTTDGLSASLSWNKAPISGL
jgi:hypothetical protein